MDINGTYFHLRTGENDWEPILAERGIDNLWWDRERASLGLLPKITQTPLPPGKKLLDIEERRGSACDQYGNFYWIDDSIDIPLAEKDLTGNDDQNEEDKSLVSRAIRILPAGTTESGIFWSISELAADCIQDEEDDFVPVQEARLSNPVLRGMCITREHYLIVGTLEPAGLLIFDLHAGGSPSWLQWPESIKFAPFDLSAAADGGVWILDRNLKQDSAHFWKLDRYFRIVNPFKSGYTLASCDSGDFVPLQSSIDSSDNTSDSYAQLDISRHKSITVNVKNAIAIEALDDDSLLVLGSGVNDNGKFSIVERYRNGQRVFTKELSGGLLERVLARPNLMAHDFAFKSDINELPGTIQGELVLVLDNGDQAIAYKFDMDRTDPEFTLTIRLRYLPLRRFSGKALVTSAGAFYYDIEHRWYPLTAQPRRSFVSDEAVVDKLIFDGKTPQCVWHRIVMDGCIPAGAAIEIQSRAADDEQLLQFSEWQQEVNPYLRRDGSEIPFHQPFIKEEMQQEGTGTWEWLFQNARGRHLELRVTFRSNGRSTPQIRALRVYYPRFSYMDRFLPSIYQQDRYHANFLDRYLANVEGFFSSLESRVAMAEAYFDTRTAPVEYLQWLAAWLGAAVDQEWDEQRQRLFIDHAELLFSWRGTQIGMRATIRLAIDECPDESIFQELKDQRNYSPTGAGGRSVRIVERFMYRDLPGVLIGDPSNQQGLAVTQVSTTLHELGDADTVSQRYREFLYHRYLLQGEVNDKPLNSLNKAWQKEDEFETFDEIIFVADPRPEQARELLDWHQFVRQQLALTQTWSPAHGGYALHVRYQESLRKKYTLAYNEGEALSKLNERWCTSYEKFEDIYFSPVVPEASLAAEDWIYFTQTELGFTYAQITEKDTESYREFFSRRYRHIDNFKQAYDLTGENTWQSFSDITLPAENQMPTSPVALHDWIQFVSLTIPIRDNAHRFTVLVPTEPGELPDSRLQRMQQVEEIVRREKPAQTNFDVKLYWVLFQVGSARLGEDTIVGESARYVGIVLGSSYMGQGLLDYSHPWHVTDRHILGRDRLQRSLQGEK